MCTLEDLIKKNPICLGPKHEFYYIGKSYVFEGNCLKNKKGQCNIWIHNHFNDDKMRKRC